jgi:hypothetical protein
VSGKPALYVEMQERLSIQLHVYTISVMKLWLSPVYLHHLMQLYFITCKRWLSVQVFKVYRHCNRTVPSPLLPGGHVSRSFDLVLLLLYPLLSFRGDMYQDHLTWFYYCCTLSSPSGGTCIKRLKAGVLT